MAFWQFLVLTVLLVGVLVSVSLCARVLGRIIGHANARLKRIEEALVVVNDRLLKRTAPGVAEPSSSIPQNKDRVGYLTIRDLKVGAQRANLQATYAGTRRNSAAVPNGREAVNTIRSRMKRSEVIIERPDPVETSTGNETLKRCDEQASSDCTRSPSVDSASANLEERERFETIGEPPGSVTVQPVNDAYVADRAAIRDPVETGGESSLASTVPASDPPAEVRARSENRDAPGATSEPHNGSNDCSPGQDGIAKQNREALLILSNQRRRRRARLGY